MAVSLADDAINRFREDGFIVLPPICTGSELDWLRNVYDRLFAQRAGWSKGDFFDFAGPDTPELEPVLPQLLEPSQFEPLLKNTDLRANALAVARQLLGPSAQLVFEHAMLKPARIGAPTPWHQDAAFFPAFTDYESISVWVPLQAVDDSNGCLQFMPGSHKAGVLPHRRINDDPRVHGLEVCEPCTGEPVSCPLPAGAATAHHCKTLHHAGPNVTEAPRRAYVLGFGIRSPQFRLLDDFPWNAQHTSARDLRADAAQGPVQRYLRQLRLTVKKAMLS